MSDSKSTFVFAGYREAQQKFDYFVTSVAGALFAYIAQTYHPKEIALTPATIEPLSLISLALAFYFGMKRIESTVVVMSLNHDMLDCEEKAGNMTKAMMQGSGVGFNVYSGEIVHHHELPARRDFYMQQARSIESHLLAVSSRGERHYKKRNLFLFLGFGAILVSKLLQPYA